MAGQDLGPEVPGHRDQRRGRRPDREAEVRPRSRRQGGPGRKGLPVAGRSLRSCSDDGRGPGGLLVRPVAGVRRPNPGRGLRPHALRHARGLDPLAPALLEASHRRDPEETRGRSGRRDRGRSRHPAPADGKPGPGSLGRSRPTPPGSPEALQEVSCAPIPRREQGGPPPGSLRRLRVVRGRLPRRLREAPNREPDGPVPARELPAPPCRSRPGRQPAAAERPDVDPLRGQDSDSGKVCSPARFRAPLGRLQPGTHLDFV